MTPSTSSPQRLKILVVYGTRPEAIKLAPVVRTLRRRDDRFETVVCSTAQHRELIVDVEELFEIRPDHDLGLMRPNQTLNGLVERGTRALDELIRRVTPDWTVVQGDTTTAMVTALASFHLGYRVAHVEAGLRTGDLTAPFPEEANRRMIDLLADLLLAPTPRSQDALLAEGCDPKRVLVTGNTVIDALRWISSTQPEEEASDEVLITVHRRESFGSGLEAILGAIADLAQAFPDVLWILPVHKNPNVAGPVYDRLSNVRNVALESALPYDELVRRMRRARFVLTDSGGIQEEAPYFGKPILVLRDKTERPEAVETGVARLVGTDRRRIVHAATELLTDPTAYRKMAREISPYGDGRASARIAASLAGEPVEPFEGLPVD